MGLARGLLPLLGLAFALAVPGCSAGGAVSPKTLGPVATGNDDPALRAAVENVRPRLEDEFSDAYAGLALDDESRSLVVYRVPRPELDAVVRADVSDVDVVFREARFCLAEMRRVAEAVLRDRGYWREVGIAIVSAHPLADGSGVAVIVEQPDTETLSLLSDRYPTMPIQVVPHMPVFPTGSPPPPIKVPG